jgi:flagellar motor component MotA
MDMNVYRWGAIAVVAAIFGVTTSALASPPMLAKAKEKGYPAQNCQYCHVSKLPKKDGFTPEDLNERGKWMLADKDKQKAKAADVESLKTFPGGKEQK